jgi:hypothetical protein
LPQFIETEAGADHATVEALFQLPEFVSPTEAPAGMGVGRFLGCRCFYAVLSTHKKAA